MSFTALFALQELRRRWLRTLVTALGLAAGVSLVVGIVGVSQGLDDAQDQVLSPLRSVGTDVLVTRVVGATAGSPGATPPAGTASPSPRGFFAGGGGGGQLNQADALALLDDNASLVTDLAQLGKPGDHFTRDFFLPATLLTFPDASVEQVARLPGVASAAGGLSLLATHQTGTIPQIVAEIQTGGETFTQTVQPAPLTPEESAAFQVCVQANGAAPPSPGVPPPPGSEQRFASVVQNCLPPRFRQLVAKFTTPLRTLRQVLDPPQTDIQSTDYTAAGVDTSDPDQGLITRAQVSAGRYFSPAATDEAMLSVAYAGKRGLHAGDSLTINTVGFHIVGLVTPSLVGNTADVYLPLRTMQQLADKPERVNEVLVKVSDAGQVDGVAAEVAQALPGAQVVTTRTLAAQVTGSLVDAKSLADRLGGALAAIILAGAFLIAVLLTLGSVAKRVREIGTLRALGWPRSLVVRQLLVETAVIGLVGALAGVGLGLGVDAAVAHLSPALTAGNIATPGQGASQLAQFFGTVGQQAALARTATRSVTITPPVHIDVLLLGAALALLGGLLAGGVGGWRAARLQPADALRDLG